MFYLKNFQEKAKEKAGQWGKLAKEIASEMIVTENEMPQKPRSINQIPLQKIESNIEDLNNSPELKSINENIKKDLEIEEKPIEIIQNESPKQEKNQIIENNENEDNNPENNEIDIKERLNKVIDENMNYIIENLETKVGLDMLNLLDQYITDLNIEPLLHELTENLFFQEGKIFRNNEKFQINTIEIKGILNKEIELNKNNIILKEKLNEKNKKLNIIEDELKKILEENIKLSSEIEEQKNNLNEYTNKITHYENTLLQKSEELNIIDQEKNKYINLNKKFLNNCRDIIFKYYKENEEFNNDKKPENLSPSEIILEFEKIVTSFSELKKNEKEKQEKLIANFTKVQSDCREYIKTDKENKALIETLKKTNDKLYEEKDNIQNGLLLKDGKIKDLQKIINDFQENKRSFVEELKLKSKEIDQGKQKIKSLEDELENLSIKLDKKTEENNLIDMYRHEINEKSSEILKYQTIIEENNIEISSLQAGLNNLQSVHEESLVRSDLLAKKYDNELKRLRNEIEVLSRKNDSNIELQKQLSEFETKNIDLEKKAKDFERKYKESEQEKSDFKMETNALIKKIKNETLYKENLVDKRVICKFLVNYFESSTTYHVKLQILETLSSILNFTNEERIKIGLHKNFLEKQIVKKNSTEVSDIFDENLKGKTVAEGETLKDKLLIYLMNEDDE